MSLAGSLTVLILTFNEEDNIGRTLQKLDWAPRVVVVDSDSTDATVEIASGYPNVTVVRHPFSSHAEQWNFGLSETGIDTEWVLSLDADYVLSDALVRELRSTDPAEGTAGYQASFRYCVAGRPLRGTLYPPVTVLFRRAAARYIQDGHTQRVVVEGKIGRLSNVILHDDRKSLGRWVTSQIRYMSLESAKLDGCAFRELGWPDRLRKLGIAPVVVLFYTLFFKKCLLDGKVGIYYSVQRTFAETLLVLFLTDRSIRGAAGPGKGR
jgi:glycosyltransferase involved in cell wall biosynthesis